MAQQLSKKKHLYFLGTNILTVVLIFILFKSGVFVALSPEQVVNIVSPIFVGLLALIPSSIVLMIFSEQILISWLKNIASWYLLLTFIMVVSVREGQGLFPMSSSGRIDTAILMMAVLFVITLVYALVMRKRLD